MRKLFRTAFAFLVLAGLRPAVPAAAVPACIPSLTVSRTPAEVYNTTANVGLQVRGTWTCGEEAPVLREVTVDGRTVRVVLEAEVVSATVLRERPFAVTTDLGALGPGESRVEVYFDDPADEEPPSLRAVRSFEVGFSCLGPVAFSVSPAGPRAGDVVSVGVEASWCNGSIGLVRVERTGRRIRFLARAVFVAGGPPSVFRTDHDAGPLLDGTYTLELAVDTAEVPGAEFQRAASSTFEVRSLCEDAPPVGVDFTEPGATLLVPYFEVDLEGSGGADTLISIGNASADPVLANVVLWTDWGIPSYAFPLYLAAGELRPVGLRALFAGAVPESGPGGAAEAPPGCEDPLTLPPLDLATLRAMHTGQPRPGDSQCAGSGAGGPAVALGYLTADVVRHCSDTVVLPGDGGYFGKDGAGRAGERNVLWGDVLYVRSADDSAQGISAVGIPALPERFVGPGPHVTFYRELVDGDGRDGRAPLSMAVRTRLLNGGSLGLRTDLLVWTEGRGLTVPCGLSPVDPERVVSLFVERTDQRGETAGPFGYVGLPQRSLRLEPDLYGRDLAFGQATVRAMRFCEPAVTSCPPGAKAEPIQTWVVPVMTADGRFSVAHEAVPLDGVCRP